MTDKQVEDAVKKSIQIDVMMRDIQEVKYRLQEVHDKIERSQPKPRFMYRTPKRETSWLSRYWCAIKTDPIWDFLKKDQKSS